MINGMNGPPTAHSALEGLGQGFVGANGASLHTLPFKKPFFAPAAAPLYYAV